MHAEEFPSAVWLVVSDVQYRKIEDMGAGASGAVIDKVVATVTVNNY